MAQRLHHDGLIKYHPCLSTPTFLPDQLPRLKFILQTLSKTPEGRLHRTTAVYINILRYWPNRL